MAVTVDTDNNLPFTLSIMDAHGNPAQVDGIPVYATSDATVMTIQAAADGMSGTVVTVAPSATPQRMTVTADADLGAGVNTITGVSDDIDVTQGASFAAKSFQITFGPPIPKS